MHDTDQLRRACQQDEFISPVFKGVFAADQVPFGSLAREASWAVIINTDPISKPGQHWVAAVKPIHSRGRCFFSILTVVLRRIISLDYGDL